MFGVLSILLGLLHKKKWLGLVILVFTYVVIDYIFQVYSDEFLILSTYHRYLDPDHGAWAVIVKTFDILNETNWMGSGLGEFMSRVPKQ